MSALLVTVTCLALLVSLGSCQVDYLQASQNAAILKDQRYLSGDGTFGAAYSQEDGVEFKEESDEYGNRRGSYSYVDPTGQRRTVTYTAGVNGFQASGDHIPSAPAPTPVQPEYVPLAQYNPPDYVPPQQQPRYQLVRRPYAPQYETQEPAQEPQPQPAYRPTARASPPARAPLTYRPAPPPAPAPAPAPAPGPAHSALLQYQAQYQAQYPEYPSSPVRYDGRYEPANLGIPAQYRVPLARPSPAPPAPPRYNYNELTTPSPRRFFPPGKLDFNRTPDGFSYTFSKN